MGSIPSLLVTYSIYFSSSESPRVDKTTPRKEKPDFRELMAGRLGYSLNIHLRAHFFAAPWFLSCPSISKGAVRDSFSDMGVQPRDLKLM